MADELTDGMTDETKEALDQDLDKLVNDTLGAGGDNPPDDNPPDDNPPEDNKPEDKKPETTIEDLTGDLDNIPTDILDDNADKSKSDEYKIDDDPEISDELKEDFNKLPDKSKDAFIKMRQEIKSLKAKTKEIENGLSDDEKKAILEENKKLQEQIEKSNFVKSPRFQREYVAPVNAMQKNIEEVGKEYGLEEADLRAAISMSRAERAQYLGEHIANQSGLAELLPMYSAYEQRLNAAKSAIDNFNKQSAAEIAKERAKHQETVQEALTVAEEELRNAGFTMLRESKIDPEWLPRIRKNAMGLLADGADIKERAKAAIASVVSNAQNMYYKTKLESLQKQLDDANRKLGKAVGNSPHVYGERNNTSSPKKDDVKTIDDLVDMTIVK
jgi:hypothetical protein